MNKQKLRGPNKNTFGGPYGPLPTTVVRISTKLDALKEEKKEKKCQVSALVTTFYDKIILVVDHIFESQFQ